MKSLQLLVVAVLLGLTVHACTPEAEESEDRADENDNMSCTDMYKEGMFLSQEVAGDVTEGRQDEETSKKLDKSNELLERVLSECDPEEIEEVRF